MPDYFEFEVELKGAKPRIWRRFLLGPDDTFHDLHVAIQDACGWWNYHLYSFYGRDPYDNVIAGNPEDADPTLDGPPVPDAFMTPLALYFGKRKKKVCGYLYDFGDDWHHKVTLKKVVRLDEEFQRRLLAGERAFPHEDCGGLGGYERCAQFVLTGRDEWGEGDELREWLGGWHPEEFDFEAVRSEFDKGRAGKLPVVVRRGPDGEEVVPLTAAYAEVHDAAIWVILRATARGSTEFWPTPMRCYRRLERKRCPGHLEVRRQEAPPEVRWRCPACGEEAAVVDNWVDTAWDMTPFRRLDSKRPPVIRVEVPEAEYAALPESFEVDEDALRALYSAEWDGKRVVLTGTEDELREIAEGVTEEANGSRGKRRLLDRLADRIEKARP